MFPSRSGVVKRTYHVHINFQSGSLSQAPARRQPGAAVHVQLRTELQFVCHWICGRGVVGYLERLSVQPPSADRRSESGEIERRLVSQSCDFFFKSITSSRNK